MTARPTLITVLPPKSRTRSVETLFSLHRDAWDDFGFKTQYQLIYHGDEEEDEIYIGNVKVLKKGQTETRRGLLDEGQLSRLDSEFCSLGQSLDYYERLAELPSRARIAIARALRDVIYRPGIVPKFRNETGWATSILRHIDDFADFASTASVLLSKDYSSLADVSLKLSFKPRGWKKAIDLDFDVPKATKASAFGYRIPKRVAVVVGRNGTGKSTMLARFARVAHAPQKLRQRDPIRTLGTLTPKGVGFTRIIAVSYSAFDSFQVPGVTIAERRQIASDIKEGIGRYIFCGLRDIAGEMKEILKPESDDDLDTAVDSQDLATTTLLKPIETLAAEFERTVDRIHEAGRFQLFREALEPIFADPSFGGDEHQTVTSVLGENPQETFLRWSTGHKIVMQIVASLTAYTQPKSIILLDEPETHLHPPLLAALMLSVRVILDQQDAFAIVATHSPVVAQESLARHVHILRRPGEDTTVSSPRIETFGESIGEITDEIFGLHAEATSFHEILEQLVRRFKTVDAVEELFGDGLSMQAHAYVMSLVAVDDDSHEDDI